jgi:hypothetical protein
MISAGQDIDTVAVGAVLIAYNWPKNTDRYRRVQRFVEAFFPRIADFRDPPRHLKWREVILAATLDGWDRFEPAQAWVEANRSQETSRLPVSSSSPQPTKDPEVPPGVDPLLFHQFLEWRRGASSKGIADARFSDLKLPMPPPWKYDAGTSVLSCQSFWGGRCRFLDCAGEACSSTASPRFSSRARLTSRVGPVAMHSASDAGVRLFTV